MRLLLALLLLTASPAFALSPMQALAGAKPPTYDYGFENSLETWSVSGSYDFSTVAHTGGYSIRLFGNPSTLTKSFTYNTGNWTFWLRPTDAAVTCQYTTNGSTWTTISATASVWNRVSVSLTAGTSTLGFKQLTANGACQFDTVDIP